MKKNKRLTGFILSGILGITLTLLLLSSYNTASDFAIINVNLIPMDKERIVENQTVLIHNGKIKQIASSESVKIPSGATVINGRGKYLIPGLFDMHAHFLYEQGENKNTCEAELKLMLVNGLTTVRIECGDSVYLVAKKNVNDKKWIGPKLFISSPQFVGNWPWPGKVFAKICKKPEEAVEAVRQCKREGYDEIKITFMVKKDVYDAIINTAKEEKIKVTGHVGPLVKLPTALAAKQQIEHMDEFIDLLLPDTSYNHGESVSDMNIWRKKAWNTVPFLDETKIPELINKVSAAGIYVTPTNYFFFSSFADSNSTQDYMNKIDYAYIPTKIKEDRCKIQNHYWKNAPPLASRKRYIEIRKKITYQLAQAGVKLMAGSDSPEWFLMQGFSIHDELETFVSCGLSPYQALETATKNPAEYLNIINQKATIEPGKDSDLILLEKNPLNHISNSRNISGIMIGKKWYPKNDLTQLLDDAKSVLSL
ncbi:amidohydrolase family protein [Aurantibacillus circumpalustris]|uniref:amidohydrolase family protein n=1 Tax=Aurantibacillus circumpalustris TaxID=3036359 RepID=UPI00295C000E|nr:amidohydrolase family protein [Aurantibacillus circumpalustris]